MLPPEAFLTADSTEMKLVSSIFDVVRAVAELKLTDTMLALYSAFVLLSPGNHLRQGCTSHGGGDGVDGRISECTAMCDDLHIAIPDRPGLKGTGEISRLNGAVLRALRYEAAKTHRHPIKGDVTVVDALLARVPQLR